MFFIMPVRVAFNPFGEGLAACPRKALRVKQILVHGVFHQQQQLLVGGLFSRRTSTSGLCRFWA